MTPTLPERVADAVAQAEKSHKVKKIAELCGVSVQTVYDWRKKKTINLKGETLVELAEVSGLNPRWIISGKGEREGGPTLTKDESTIIEAFRLFGADVKELWLESARSRISKEQAATALDEPRKQA